MRVPVKAGPRTVVATFLTDSEAQDDNILEPFERANLDALDFRGLPVVDRVSITGPLKATGPGDTPSRRLIFVCHPANHAEELPCAQKIITRLAHKAYRRPVTDNDMETLLELLSAGPQRRRHLRFRESRQPSSSSCESRVSVPFRARSRQSGGRRGLSHQRSGTGFAAVLLPVEHHPRRAAPERCHLRVSCTDPPCSISRSGACWPIRKSKALVDNFADQWLYLRNLKNINPDFETFPDFDDNLRQAMKEETDLFFGSIIHEDRSVIDLLTANYTFINERLARHYGIPDIYGTDFRRVTLTTIPAASACLGQASILTVTSYADPHFARAARQVDSDELDRHAADPAAAQRAGAEGKSRRWSSHVAARAHGRASQEHALRRLPSNSWIRLDSRWRISTR